MRRRTVEYGEAVKLRKEGFSYSEITEKIKVSRSTLSSWLHSIPVTLNRWKTTPSEVFRTQGQRLHAERLEKTAVAIKLAREEIEPLSLRELKIVGAMLYWAEGTKDAKTEIVEISNSDPKLIRVALRWLRVICGVPNEKIHIQMHIHTDLDPEECMKFWMEVTGLPREQFMKSQIKHSSLGHRKKRLYQGTIQIRVWDRQIFRRIQGWIQGLRDDHSAPVAQLDRAGDF